MASPDFASHCCAPYLASSLRNQVAPVLDKVHAAAGFVRQTHRQNFGFSMAYSDFLMLRYTDHLESSLRNQVAPVLGGLQALPEKI